MLAKLLLSVLFTNGTLDGTDCEGIFFLNYNGTPSEVNVMCKEVIFTPGPAYPMIQGQAEIIMNGESWQGCEVRYVHGFGWPTVDVAIYSRCDEDYPVVKGGKK